MKDVRMMLGKKKSADFCQDRCVFFERFRMFVVRIDLPEDEASRFGVIFICFFSNFLRKKWDLFIGRSWGTSRDAPVKMTGWWFQIFFIFTPTWGKSPF